MGPTENSHTNRQSPLSPPRTHESVWKRSKKILGLSRFEFLQESYADDLEKKSIGGDANGGENTVDRRREQVRRAQKKHRARTDAYVKALEQEVVRLQKVEAEHKTLNQRFLREQSYIKRLEKQVVLLQKTHMPNFQGQQARYELPTGTQVNVAHTAMASLLDQDGQYILAARMPESPIMDNALNIAPVESSMSCTDFEVQNGLHCQTLGATNPFGNQQMAIDFVLRLEEACMPHLQAHMANPSGSTVSGHALTASACLISQSQSAVSPPSSWPTSYAEIDRLFYLSSKLNLCGELTPIEAWNRIWSHPSAGRLTAEGFRILEQDLKGLITCYGFGAVMDELKFSIVLDSFFKNLAT